MANLICAFWAILVLVVFCQYVPLCHGIPFGNKIGVFIILILGAPVIVLDSIIQSLLDYFLPEGWDMQ